VQRKITSLMRAIENGLYEPSMKERLAAGPKLSSIRFHPGLARQYRNKVANLEEVLAHPATHPNTVASIRRQIEKITLTLRPDGSLEVLLYGDLARVLQFCEEEEHKSQRPGRGGPGRGLSVVAGAGFEPATFRL
jgi:site-specific DNA recombinase